MTEADLAPPEGFHWPEQVTRTFGKIDAYGWDVFRETLEKRRLQAYESSGYLKIMKKRH